MQKPVRNERLTGFRCLRCAGTFGIEDHWEGCPDCLAAGYPASLVATYAESSGDQTPSSARDLRYGSWLPYRAATSLGEGGTPVVTLPRLAREIGTAGLFVKNESANPTGSHKDRMSVQAIARAVDIGASLVIGASSGNAGVSIAAYAAASGLRCEIVVASSIAPVFRRAIESYGATLVTVPDSLSRWTHVERRVHADGAFPITNFHIPPVGSNPFGVEGFKTIAFELAEQFTEDLPEAVLVPTSRADLLIGLFLGFRELAARGRISTTPQLYAAEPLARLSRVVAGCDYRLQHEGATQQLSTAGTTVTYQGVAALQGSGGDALVVGDAEARHAQSDLARCGLYAELSSAAALAGLRQLVARRMLRPDSRAVLIMTSSGFKDP